MSEKRSRREAGEEYKKSRRGAGEKQERSMRMLQLRHGIEKCKLLWGGAAGGTAVGAGWGSWGWVAPWAVAGHGHWEGEWEWLVWARLAMQLAKIFSKFIYLFFCAHTSSLSSVSEIAFSSKQSNYLQIIPSWCRMRKTFIITTTSNLSGLYLIRSTYLRA